MRIKVTTHDYDYMGLCCNTIIPGVSRIRGKAYFELNGKQWELSDEEFVLITELPDKLDCEVDPLSVQIGGNHYKGCKIQPIEYIFANGLGYAEGNVVKYITRWKNKNGIEDLKKVIHYAELLIQEAEKDE